ncbi:MAG: polyribonucleotide nucleotidyltransferase [Dehalococcoidia bacterium]
MSEVFECLVGGRTLSIEVGKLGEQAAGAVTVRFGDTVVLATACMGDRREGGDRSFLPLTVDFEERLYAAGKIPGGFIRREGRPTQDATLVCRLTDRSIRPLFPKGFRNELQAVITTLSADQENEPDVLAIVGVSAALTISDIPFAGPLSAVKVGDIDGQLVANPTFSELERSLQEMVVVGTKEAVVMVEAGAQEVSEERILEAIKFGQEANLEIIRLQERMRASLGKPKMEFKPPEPEPGVEEAVLSLIEGRLEGELEKTDMSEREEGLDALRKELLERLEDTYPRDQVLAAFEGRFKSAVRSRILEDGRRLDGRSPADIRPIACEVGLLPRTHGSGLFTRGQTQVLTITTLGTPGDEQRLDGISPEESKGFIHHYNFPPFSTGEVKRIGTPGRREIGHGALVERSLLPVIPGKEEFPYTIRLVSEVLSSKGSSSMASACGSSLSMMDAGVPMKAPVAGIAMGLITGNGKHAILTDIAGVEDAYGDMDFKVAGTAQGITALQMDIKLQGIGWEILSKALSQAREARLYILEKMGQAIASSRSEISSFAPRMYKMTIKPEKIGAVIGPGGRVIRSMVDEYKVSIDVQNDGTVTIGSTSEEAAQRAMKAIGDLTKEVEVGTVYTGKVTRLLNFAVMVEILPGKEGMIHISELADYRVPQVSDVVKIGDEIMVKVIEIDRLGRVNLSRRAVLEGSSYKGGSRGGDSLSQPRPPTRYPPRPSGPPHRTSGPGDRGGRYPPRR